ncbi:MAG: hypothetical protein P4L31_08735 [Candidatus Babeliales bacterium]|nr:hypothetical protein [Candidatus Babeliales bacterium]
MSANRFAALAIDDEPKNVTKTVKIAPKQINEKADIKPKTYRKPITTTTSAAKKDTPIAVPKIPAPKAPSVNDASLFPSLAPSTGAIEPIKELMITPKQRVQQEFIASIGAKLNVPVTIKATPTTPTMLRVGNMHLKGNALAAYEELQKLEDAIRPYIDAILESRINVPSAETDFKSVDCAYDDFASMAKDYIAARATYKTHYVTYPVRKYMTDYVTFCFDENKRVVQGLKMLQEIRAMEQEFSDSEIDE